MAGKSPVAATEEQRRALMALSRSRDRGEADRARAILLTLSGWTSGQIAEAFKVREDTVLAQRLRHGWDRGTEEISRAGAGPDQGCVRIGCC